MRAPEMLRRDDKVCKYIYGLNIVTEDLFFWLPLSMKAKIPLMIANIQNIILMNFAESILSKHS